LGRPVATHRWIFAFRAAYRAAGTSEWTELGLPTPGDCPLEAFGGGCWRGLQIDPSFGVVEGISTVCDTRSCDNTYRESFASEELVNIATSDAEYIEYRLLAHPVFEADVFDLLFPGLGNRDEFDGGKYLVSIATDYVEG